MCDNVCLRQFRSEPRYGGHTPDFSAVVAKAHHVLPHHFLCYVQHASEALPASQRHLATELEVGHQCPFTRTVACSERQEIFYLNKEKLRFN